MKLFFASTIGALSLFTGCAAEAVPSPPQDAATTDAPSCLDTDPSTCDARTVTFCDHGAPKTTACPYACLPVVGCTGECVPGTGRADGKVCDARGLWADPPPAPDPASDAGPDDACTAFFVVIDDAEVLFDPCNPRPTKGDQ